MQKSWTRVTAKVLWIVPLFLVLLAINQAIVALDIKHTLDNGKEKVADVLEVRVNDRVDIPFGYVSLKVELDSGQELVQEKMALPYTLLPQVKNQEQLRVYILPEARQKVVIAGIASTQWKMAGMQSAICFFAFIMAGIGVFSWNRFLKKKGDPAERESPSISK